MGFEEALLIRSYEPEDHEPVLKLHEDGLRQTGTFVEDRELDGDLLDVESAYLASGGDFLVGVLDGRVVAMGALKRASSDEAEIKRMRVEPALQGRGYGQRMLDALHRCAAERGYSILSLDTTVQQTAARSLYLKNGYRETRRGSTGPFDRVFYAKDTVA